MIAKELLGLTKMDQIALDLLTKEYKAANGNISRTARIVGWPRTKTVKKLKDWKLYDLYPHEPGPIAKEK